MLPLWIIDISTNRDRREPLVALLRQVEHVHISNTFAILSDKAKKSNPAADHSEPDSVLESAVQAASLLERAGVSEDLSNSLSQQELLDQLERRAAERDAVIKGDYWYYSAFNDVFRGLGEITSETLDDKDNVAERLYA
jgi:hypothetical protein